MTSNDPTSPGPLERVEADGIVLTWSPDTRLLRLKTVHSVNIGTGVARRSVDAVNSWVGDSKEPFGYLCDTSGIENADAAGRIAWGECFDAHRDIIRAAWYAASPHMQVMIRMFVTGLRAKGPFIGEAFLEEDKARAWLREQNIDA